MDIEKLENKHIGSPAVSNVFSVSQTRPALPTRTASSKLTPSDSHPPTIDIGPPTEMVSDSSSASVPSSFNRLLTSPLLTTASRTMGGSGGTDQNGTQQHPGLLRNSSHDNYPRLSQQLDSFSFSHQA